MAGEPEPSFASITTQSQLEPLLAEYPQIVPPKLEALDTARYETIPKARSERVHPGHLTKLEVVQLVEWKLSHGTFRPSLKKLVESNSDWDIENSTTQAYIKWNKGGHGLPQSALESLTKLKGIGPATASLLLSVRWPERAPFFSDELFRWVFWEEGKGLGWDRKIKYTAKEYFELYEKVREKEGLGAVDLEKVAYVLGKRAAGKGREQKKVKDVAEAEAEVKEAAKANGKRKAEYGEPKAVPTPKKRTSTPASKSASKKTSTKAAQGTRTSTRLKEKK